MQDVFNGKLPDRVPFFPTIYTDHACMACGKRFENALINPAECMLGAALRYKTDAVRFCMGPDASWYEEKVVAQREDGKLIQFSRRSGNPEGYYDVEGGGGFIPAEAVHPVVRSIPDVRGITVTSSDEYLERGCLKDVMRCVQTAHDHGLFVVGMSGGQTGRAIHLGQRLRRTT